MAGGTLDVQTSQFNTNTARTNGGAIYTTIANPTIAADTFSGNTAGDTTTNSGAGGAIYNNFAGSVTIGNSAFTANQALTCVSCGTSAFGGAIYASALVATLTLTGATLSAVPALQRAAIVG